MKLTRAGKYSLQALIEMARRNLNAPVASHVIAAVCKIPERFLLKVLKPLVSSRVLVSIKGPNGGYRLARPASKISMLEVLESVEGPIAGDVAGITDGDKTDSDVANIAAVIVANSELQRKHLARVSVAQLAAGKGA